MKTRMDHSADTAVVAVSHDDSVEAGRAGKVEGQTRAAQQDDAANLFLGDDSVFEYTEQQGNAVRLKLDLVLLSIVTMSYMLSFIDKVALSNASILGIREGDHLQGQQYSWVSAIFYFGYLIAQYPSSILMQKMPLGRYFGTMIMLWVGRHRPRASPPTGCSPKAGPHDDMHIRDQQLCHPRHGSILPRHLRELPRAHPHAARGTVLDQEGAGVARVHLVGRRAAGGLHARRHRVRSLRVGLPELQICELAGKGSRHARCAPAHAVQVLFLIFGPISMAWGVFLFLFLPSSPMTAWFLSEREKKIAVMRVIKNHTGIENRNYRLYQVKECLMDPQPWMLWSLALLQCVFDKIVLTGLGYDSHDATKQSFGGDGVQLFSVIATGVVTLRIKNTRIIASVVSNIVVLIGALLVSIMFVNTVTYGMVMSLVASNIGGFTKKATCSVMVFVGYGIGQIIAPQFFLAQESPSYPTGFRAFYVSTGLMIAILVVLYIYLRRENHRRDKSGATVNLEQVADSTAFLDLTDREQEAFRYVLHTMDMQSHTCRPWLLVRLLWAIMAVAVRRWSCAVAQCAYPLSKTGSRAPVYQPAYRSIAAILAHSQTPWIPWAPQHHLAMPRASPFPRPARRSVSGCLTCRRRKVKCDGAPPPCANCRRARAACAPSFHSNFRTWASAASRAVGERSDADPSSARALSAVASPGSVVGGDASGDGTRLVDDVASNAQPQWACSPAYVLGSDPATSVSGSANSDAQLWFGLSTAWNDTVPSFSNGGIESASLDADMSIPEASLTDCARRPSSPAIDFLDLLSWSIPPSIPLFDAETHEADQLINHYRGTMTEFVSCKSAPWNFYTYILQSSQDQSDSPVRHSILAWAFSHLSWREQKHSYARGLHYTRAKTTVHDLRTELAHLLAKSSGGAGLSIKLSMLLSTSLFLAHCDVMYGDHGALLQGLRDLKGLLVSGWHILKDALGGLHIRILVWLAYLDVRSRLWADPKHLALGPGTTQLYLFGLLTTCRKSESLRQVNNSQYYLFECFGDSYPDREWHNDLLDEPMKLVSDEAMSLFSNIRDFEAWSEQVSPGTVASQSITDEIRSAKILRLRADIARVRAECKMAYRDLLHSSINKDHSKSQYLKMTCLLLAATIMLNRAVSPRVRTDDEAQEAARELVRLVRHLRKSGELRSPRSLAWPMPIFVAGIEVTDEIYQDWVLGCMDELSDWGASIQKTTDLLRVIIEKQAVEKVRVNPRYLMQASGEVVII
ncbi:putative transporter [Tolypocladium ophioglossoides CBS 100239]|uniref:Putative transporter n=1 Tax=Tolypocladium ophioglossoides (strain CBS 100239) TaxID=1163406 RepID=A0A0L0N7P2_TOLOC|nr:putative transporter [Tolypocladium ophioglossoides CBS 100239]